ncbi:FAD-dependent oxidoreductase [Gaiella sp.]|uniref:FAD-dependent oxidoreductase n=1 Tax=Gaiella sp. TaxID=2663207 RepID=UPI003982FA6F
MSDRELRVVIIGGGVAALEAVLALDALAGTRVGVEVVAPEPQFFYRPLSVAAPFSPDELRRYDLGALLSPAGALLTLGTVTAVDAGAHEIRTADGGVLRYDALLVACGTQPRTAVEGALTFRGPSDVELVSELLDDADKGRVNSIAFSVPGGAVWGLPAYELALLTAAWLEARGRRDVSIVLTTPEEAPLELFGADASSATAALLEHRGIEIRTRARALHYRERVLTLASGETIAVDRVVAMPRLVGQSIPGLPQTRHGFVPIDRSCRVVGLPGVYAAGDITTFPVKQGGIAAQQADVAAQEIASAAGADVVPQSFRPVLRGMLLTGSEPLFMRHDLAHHDESPVVSLNELWWPPAKIAGHYLGPLILSLGAPGARDEEGTEPEDGVAVHVELDPDAGLQGRTEVAADDAPAAGDAVGDLATGPLLLVAPEDTLGEVAARLCDLDTGSAVVAEYGKAIGIITTRDLLGAFAHRIHPSEGRVRAWMTAHPFTIRAGQSRQTAAALMTEHSIHHLPIVDDRGNAIAILGLRDVVQPGS